LVCVWVERGKEGFAAPLSDVRRRDYYYYYYYDWLDAAPTTTLCIPKELELCKIGKIYIDTNIDCDSKMTYSGNETGVKPTLLAFHGSGSNSTVHTVQLARLMRAIKSEFEVESMEGT